MSAAIVTLTRFPDIFEALARSVAEHDPSPRRIVVISGGAELKKDLAWQQCMGAEPFIWARNANLGIAAVGREDVLLANDDVQLLGPTVAPLAAICEANPEIGVLSPQIIGGINNPQAAAGVKLYGDWTESRSPLLPFVCVYLPRRVLDVVGPLDESFTGYGGDDEDWCLRARRCGFKLAITSKVKVRHGFGGREYSSSFFRTMTPSQRQASLDWSRRRIQELHP